MKQLNTQLGFTGSEIERAAMAGGVFPTEWKVEKTIKHHFALGLARIAKSIDPSILRELEIRTAQPRNC